MPNTKSNKASYLFGLSCIICNLAPAVHRSPDGWTIRLKLDSLRFGKGRDLMMVLCLLHGEIWQIDEMHWLMWCDSDMTWYPIFFYLVSRMWKIGYDFALHAICEKLQDHNTSEKRAGTLLLNPWHLEGEVNNGARICHRQPFPSSSDTTTAPYRVI
jgi:hypothetical protein